MPKSLFGIFCYTAISTLARMDIRNFFFRCFHCVDVFVRHFWHLLVSLNRIRRTAVKFIVKAGSRLEWTTLVALLYECMKLFIIISRWFATHLRAMFNKNKHYIEIKHFCGKSIKMQYLNFFFKFHNQNVNFLKWNNRFTTTITNVRWCFTLKNSLFGYALWKNLS